jgi:hypothetical protein
MKGHIGKFLMKLMKDIHSFFKSMKTAIVLLVVIAALAALSTLVPQGRDAAYYSQRYAPPLSQLILSLGFNSFFRTPLFLIPVALFFINLTVCALHRIVKRLRSGAPKRFGPDLIHLGILLLIVGGIISLISRRETYFTLSAGEFAGLPDGHQLFLTSFTYATYADGRPKDYVSSVEIRKGDMPVGSADIRVNKPLKIEDLKIYQDSFSRTVAVLLEDEQGRSVNLTPGEGFRLGDRFFFFMGLEPGSPPPQRIEAAEEGERLLNRSLLLFEELDRNGLPVETHALTVSDRLAAFTIENVKTTDQTILRVVQDRGFVPVLIAFFIIGAGLTLTFVQKLGEANP